jgi:hypothetical protein
MIKKTLLLLILLFLIKTGYSQQAAYTFPLPQNWGTEKINFPIDFAPKIALKGVEELRFTPGWGDSKSEEYWSYAFLWFVEGKPSFNVDILQSYLTQYFNGLYISNLKNKTAPLPSNFTQAQVKKVTTLPNDQETYEGAIATLNFLTGQAINFNACIHIRNFDNIKRTAVLYEISPLAFGQSAWASLDAVVGGFRVAE